MPDAGRTHGPPAKKKQAAVTTGSAETTGIPRATVLTLISCSPRCTGLFGHRSRTRIIAPSTWHQRRDARTTRLHVRQARVRLTPAQRPSHPRPTCRDDRAQRPSARGGMAEYNHRFLKKRKQIYFSRAGPDSTNRVEIAGENNFLRARCFAPMRLFGRPRLNKAPGMTAGRPTFGCSVRIANAVTSPPSFRRTPEPTPRGCRNRYAASIAHTSQIPSRSSTRCAGIGQCCSLPKRQSVG